MSKRPAPSSGSGGDIKVARYRRRTHTSDEPDGEDLSDDDVGVSSDEDDEIREKNWAMTGTTIPPNRDFSTMIMKKDADKRPIYVCRDGRVFLETFSPIYRQAYDFLIAISDPIARPHYIHEYKITSYSLYAAASLGLRTDDIVGGLQRLSKNELERELIAFIHDKTDKCGKVKLVMKKTRYYVESIYPDILNHLLKNEVVRDARIDDKPSLMAEAAQKQTDAIQQTQAKKPANTSFYSDRTANNVTTVKTYDEREAKTTSDGMDTDMIRDPDTGFLVSNADANKIMLPGTGKESKAVDQNAAMGLNSDDAKYGLDDEMLNKKILSIEIAASKVEQVRETCNKINYPMLEEYDFRRDTSTPDLPINLNKERE